MQQLRRYKKLLHITCPSCEPNNGLFLFQIKFEQINPHNIFKYELTKFHQEIIQLFKMFEQQLFDFQNPFGGGLIDKIKQSHSDMTRINQALQESLGRIDVICHKSFVQFFCIQLHYQDFVDGLKPEENGEKKKEGLSPFEEYKGMFQKEAPWEKKEKSQEQNGKENKQAEKKSKKKYQTSFDRAIDMGTEIQGCQLDLMKQSQILDFTYLEYNQSKLLYVLQQPIQKAKIKNFFKSFFSQNPKQLGFLSIHLKVNNKYTKKSTVQLLAQPLSMQYIPKTNLLLITTPVGVYIYLPKLETKYEQIDILSYIELLGCVGCAHSSLKGEIYLISRLQSTGKGELHVYGINSEKLMKTQYHYDHPQSICYEEQHCRLYISDSTGVSIYFVAEYMEIKRLHVVSIDYGFTRLTINHGFLLGLADKGFLTALELRQPQKESLTSVTTTINLPEGVKRTVGSSKNRRLIVTYYKQCVVFIDTIEGPIFSIKIHQTDQLVSIFADLQKGQVIVLGKDGRLSVVELSDLII